MGKEIVFFLVDDDADDREIFSLALARTNQNVKCIAAKEGEEALAILKKNEEFVPDSIFLDLNMPRMDGKQCLVEMRKMEQLKNVPICIYTTSSSEKDKTETLNLGANGFITKPHSIKKLIELLSEIIKRISK